MTTPAPIDPKLHELINLLRRPMYAYNMAHQTTLPEHMRPKGQALRESNAAYQIEALVLAYAINQLSPTGVTDGTIEPTA